MFEQNKEPFMSDRNNINKPSDKTTGRPAGKFPLVIDRENFERYREMSELNERQTRLLCGWFASSIGHGGQKKVAEALGIGVNTVRAGREEFQGKTRGPEAGRIRREGGGRKATEVLLPGLKNSVFLVLDAITDDHGCEPVLFWSTQSLRDIQKTLEERGYRVSHATVGRLIGELGYEKRLNRKMPAPHPDREEQFRLIDKTAAAHLSDGDPVVYVDCSLKPEDAEKILERYSIQEKLLKSSPFETFPVDERTAFAALPSSGDLQDLAAESVLLWWRLIGRPSWPRAARLMVVCDGFFSGDETLFTKQLAFFARETGLEITVCHMPAGTTKWNRVPHRLYGCGVEESKDEKKIGVSCVVSTVSAVYANEDIQIEAVDPEELIRRSNDFAREKQQLLPDVAPIGAFGKWNYRIRGCRTESPGSMNPKAK